MKERLRKELRIAKAIFSRKELYERGNYYLGGFIAGTGHPLMGLASMLTIIIIMIVIERLTAKAVPLNIEIHDEVKK